jgi:SRSO17 transposase
MRSDVKRYMCPGRWFSKTKSEIALGILNLPRAWGLPFKHVVADADYGDNPLFLEGLKERACPYVCGVEGSFGLRLPQEVMTATQAPPSRQGRGRLKKERPARLNRAEDLVKA